ncbi:MFS transporter [Cellulomonas sp. NPDC089187]|uniref:MFS transporter n=1 Tax=Cellulomonas sp. NPDC089187 TaxID=3154970 RepID=UPI0034424EBE
MSLGSYGRMLRLPGVLPLTLIAFVARIPHAMTGVTLTLHVVLGLGRGYAQAGVVAAAMTVGMAIGAPWRGRRVDRIGLRRAVIPSVLVSSVVWVIAPRLDYVWLIVAAVVAGVFLVPVFSVVRQSLSVLVPQDQQRTAFAFDSVCTEVTFMVGPVLAAFLATSLSTTTALTVIGASTVLSGVALFWANPPTTSVELARRRGIAVPTTEVSADAPVPGTAGRSWLSPGLVVILASASVAAVLLNGTDVSIVAALEDWGQPGSVGWVVALWCLGSAVGGLVYGASPLELHPLTLVAVFGLCTIPAALAQTPGQLAVAIVISGIPCAATLSSINASLVRMVPEHRRGEVMGWSGTANTLGGAVGAPVCGAVIDALGAQAGFAFAGGAGVVLAGFGLLAMTALRRRGLSSPRR